MGYDNVIAIVGAVLFIAQLITQRWKYRIDQDDEQSIKNALSRRFLDITLKLLSFKYPKVRYRAMVTIRDHQVRTTILGSNIRSDPELALSVPLDFGISGLAFSNRSAEAGDVTDVNKDNAALASKRIKGTIWADVKSVLAVPLLTEDLRESFGTVNFDADRMLVDSHLNDRQTKDILCLAAELVNSLMNGYSPDGTVRRPS